MSRRPPGRCHLPDFLAGSFGRYRSTPVPRRSFLRRMFGI